MQTESQASLHNISGQPTKALGAEREQIHAARFQNLGEPESRKVMAVGSTITKFGCPHNFGHVVYMLTCVSINVFAG